MSRESRSNVRRMLMSAFPMAFVVHSDRDAEDFEKKLNVLLGKMNILALAPGHHNEEKCFFIFLPNALSGDMFDNLANACKREFGERWKIATVPHLADQAFEMDSSIPLLCPHADKLKGYFIRSEREDDEDKPNISEMLEELFKTARQNLKD